jgi:hypothetical protein
VVGGGNQVRGMGDYTMLLRRRKAGQREVRTAHADHGHGAVTVTGMELLPRLLAETKIVVVPGETPVTVKV